MRPYTLAARTRLGRPADVLDAPQPGGSALARLAERLGRLADGRSDEALALRLRQAGVLAALADGERVQQYRVAQALRRVTERGPGRGRRGAEDADSLDPVRRELDKR